MTDIEKQHAQDILENMLDSAMDNGNIDTTDYNQCLEFLTTAHRRGDSYGRHE